VGATRCSILDEAFILGELKPGRVYYRQEHCRLKLFLTFFIKECLMVTVRVSMLNWMDFRSDHTGQIHS